MNDNVYVVRRYIYLYKVSNISQKRPTFLIVYLKFPTIKNKLIFYRKFSYRLEFLERSNQVFKSCRTIKLPIKKYLFYQTPLGIFLTLLCINFIIVYKGIVFSFPTPSMGYFHQVTTPTSILYDSPTKPAYCLHIVYLT